MVCSGRTSMSRERNGVGVLCEPVRGGLTSAGRDVTEPNPPYEPCGCGCSPDTFEGVVHQELTDAYWAKHDELLREELKRWRPTVFITKP